jgi:hypothetical protein
MSGDGRMASEGLRRLLHNLSVSTQYGVPQAGVPPRALAPRVHSDRRIPGWVILLALAAAAGIALNVGAALADRQPGSLRQAALTGERRLHGKACIVLAPDVSGSMSEHATTRRLAVQDLMTFSRRSLALNDVLMVVAFDNTVEIALAPTNIASLPAASPAEPALHGTGTEFEPAVRTLAESLRAQDCAAVGLASVTDGEFEDDPRRLRDALAAAGLTRVQLLVPGGKGRPGPTGASELLSVDVNHFRPGDSAQLGLKYGRLIADLTGQKLARR